MPLLIKRKNGTIILNKKEFRTHIRKILGVRPGNLQIYEMALIHRSASLNLPNGTRINNERLEFLGDSIINGILSHWLFEKYPEASEGYMTKIKSKIVNRDLLNDVAIKMGIDKILVSNLSPGNSTKNLYGNAFEALTGAIFLDKGYIATKKFLVNQVMHKFVDLKTLINTDKDYKSLIFEWAQKKKLALSFITNEIHDPLSRRTVFSSILLINEIEYGKGQGSSKKEAEQDAASEAWEKIKEIS
ncbi:MAG: ribonuclease III [Bacteroidales bacterium]